MTLKIIFISSLLLLLCSTKLFLCGIGYVGIFDVVLLLVWLSLLCRQLMMKITQIAVFLLADTFLLLFVIIMR